ncbi:MAG: sugar transferase [Clostridia bacterium]|nr:sugar transferase [Clostridia bacterium]
MAANNPILKKKPFYDFFKRLFDLLASGLALLLLLPAILLLLLIKFLEDGHNPVYISKRVGKNGALFPFFKIRSMSPKADLLKQEMMEQGLNEADGPAFKIKDDPRITPFGKWLRKWSLDEILQLLNVFLGHMSVVGPRPPLPQEVALYTEEQKQRLLVKGGLLCLWQIQPNRHSISFDDWVKSDLEYIEKRNFRLDLKIIFTGAYMILSGKSGD